MKNQVMKALSQEDMTILGNIKSLIDEMMNMSQAAPVQEAAPAPEEDQVMDAADPEAPEDIEAAKSAEEEEKEAAKSVAKESGQGPWVETPGDDEDATGPAQAVMDDKLQEQTQENLADLGKAFKAMMALMAGQKQPVKKSVNPMVDAMATMMEAMKATNKKVDMLAGLYEQDLEARGVFKQLDVAQREVAKARKPVVAPDAGDVVEYLAGILSQVNKSKDEADPDQKVTPVSSNSARINKNLRDPLVMKHLMSEDSYNRLYGGQK